jgi:hypothetical protein
MFLCFSLFLNCNLILLNRVFTAITFGQTMSHQNKQMIMPTKFNFPSNKPTFHLMGLTKTALK